MIVHISQQCRFSVSSDLELENVDFLNNIIVTDIHQSNISSACLSFVTCHTQ